MARLTRRLIGTARDLGVVDLHTQQSSENRFRFQVSGRRGMLAAPRRDERCVTQIDGTHVLRAAGFARASASRRSAGSGLGQNHCRCQAIRFCRQLPSPG